MWHCAGHIFRGLINICCMNVRLERDRLLKITLSKNSRIYLANQKWLDYDSLSSIQMSQERTPASIVFFRVCILVFTHKSSSLTAITAGRTCASRPLCAHLTKCHCFLSVGHLFFYQPSDLSGVAEKFQTQQTALGPRNTPWWR